MDKLQQLKDKIISKAVELNINNPIDDGKFMAYNNVILYIEELE